MNNEILALLQRQIEKNHPKADSQALFFGMDRLDYDFSTRTLTAEVVHFREKDLVYSLKFEGVHAYKIIREAYAESYADENFKGVGFLAVSEHSRFQQFCFDHSLMQVQYVEVYENDRTDLKTYRIAGQNGILDVLTDGLVSLNVFRRTAS